MLFALVPAAALLLQAAAAAPPAARPLAVHVVDAAKAPVRGAHVAVEPAVPAEMALAELLARRAGVSKADGVLDLGLVPADEPLALRIGAPGYRTGTLRLPAGFEAGRRDVVLVPNQDVEVRVTGLAVRKGEARPEVTLAPDKARWPAAGGVPPEPVRARLDGEGRARFRRVEGGFYDAELRVPGIGSTRETVEVARGGDAPAVVVDMAVGEWTVRGTAQLHDGRPVPARVTAVETGRGAVGGAAAGTRASADGTFELKVVSKAGRGLRIEAESDDPRAVSNASAPIPLDDARAVIEDVVVELDATAVEALVRDARSDEALPGCAVLVEQGEAGEPLPRRTVRTTDADGIAREDALSGGTVRLAVTCRGHYAKDLGDVAVARDETTRVDAALEPARDLVLSVVDEGRRPVPGASVFAPDGPLSGYGSSGRFGGVPLAGLTDDAGELSLEGEAYGGRLVFVVAPGRALAMRLLPAPASCDRPEDCRAVVGVAAPQPSAGVLVRSESGEEIRPVDLAIRSGPFPLPWAVLTAVLRVNGLDVDAPAPTLDLRVAGLLPGGVYSVALGRRKADPKTKKEIWVDVPLGTFSVPSLERVELVER
jgi:hypothetical protein